jgi:hypothetical protein
MVTDLSRIPYLESSTTSSRDHVLAPHRAAPCPVRRTRGRDGRWLRHPQGHNCAHQRVDHRQAPDIVARARGVSAGEVRREQDGRQRAGL